MYNHDDVATCLNNDSIYYVATYGYLYNWETAKTVCPAGWHLPSDAEWKTLIDYFGYSASGNIAGGMLKATSKWSSPNTDATNSSGFTALPGGYRDFMGGNTFKSIGKKGYWWSSTEFSSKSAWHLYMLCSSGAAYQSFLLKNTSGFSVRCLKD